MKAGNWHMHVQACSEWIIYKIPPDADSNKIDDDIVRSLLFP